MNNANDRNGTETDKTVDPPEDAGSGKRARARLRKFEPHVVVIPGSRSGETDKSQFRDEDNEYDSPDHRYYIDLFHEMQEIDEVVKLMLTAVESGDIGSLHRMIQSEDLTTAMNKPYPYETGELDELKTRSIRFFFRVAMAAVRGGFDLEEAETLYAELSSRLDAIETFDELLALQQLVVSTYGDPLFRKSSLNRVSLSDRVNRYIHENYMQKLTIAQISAALYLHPNYLMKKYKAESGKSIMQAVNDKRIFESINLLRSTNLPIEKIARSTGFETPQYFNAVFRKRTGKSPNQVRRESQEKSGDSEKRK